MKKFIAGAVSGVVLSGLLLAGAWYFVPSASSFFTSQAPAEEQRDARFPKIKNKPEVRPFMGQWSSDRGVLPGMDRKWIVLWIAGNGSFQFELKGPGGVTGTTLWSSKGTLVKTENGSMGGTISDPRTEFKPLEKFTISKPENGKMMITGNEVAVNLKFQGL